MQTGGTDVLDSFANAEQEERSLGAVRAELAERFYPEAVDPEALMFVVEAARQSGSIWLRLWPAWWKIKKELLSWYRNVVPSFRVLRADILRLEKYHRRGVAVRQVVAEHATDLIMGSEGKPDWAASAERVRAVEWLEQIGVQHTFKAAVGPRRTLNRIALGDAAAELARLSTELRESWSRLLTEFAVPDAQTQLSRSATELTSFFGEEAEKVRKEADALAVFASGLSPEKDVLPGVYRERALALRDLVAARARIEKARTLLNDPARARSSKRPTTPRKRLAAGNSSNSWTNSTSPSLLPSLPRSPNRPRARSSAMLCASPRVPADRSTRHGRRVTTDLFDPNAEVSTNITSQQGAVGRTESMGRGSRE